MKLKAIWAVKTLQKHHGCTSPFGAVMLAWVFLFVSPLSKAQEDEAQYLSLQPVVSDLPASWAIKVSPEKFLYVTHRDGTIAQYSFTGQLLGKVDLALDDLYVAGQGGLSAIAFHPNFADTPWVYLSYSFGNAKANGLKVIRIMLNYSQENGLQVVQKETVYEQLDLRSTAVHYGARLAFMLDASLLISTGDGFDYRESAQQTSSDMGKILRLTDTGGIPTDNPFVSANSFTQQAIYSLGHRNPQGLVVLPNNLVIAHEHGPAGGDEVNIIKPGYNYGWPVITQGKDYIGSLITPFTEYPDMQQPNMNWTPSIAPSGMIFYNASNIQPFAFKLLITSLKYKQLHGLSMSGEEMGDEVVFFADSRHRMRDITMSENGRVFILSDGELSTIFEVVSLQ